MILYTKRNLKNVPINEMHKTGLLKFKIWNYSTSKKQCSIVNYLKTKRIILKSYDILI